MNGRTNKQINERTDKNVLQDFVPFGAAAQKLNAAQFFSIFALFLCPWELLSGLWGTQDPLTLYTSLS